MIKLINPNTKNKKAKKLVTKKKHDKIKRGGGMGKIWVF